MNGMRRGPSAIMTSDIARPMVIHEHVQYARRESLQLPVAHPVELIHEVVQK
jgi:hypothetical protein